MKVAVITPYHTEPLDMLKRAHDSVMAQTDPCTHYMVADGHARTEVNDWPVRHIALPVEHNNNGNTPRAIGSLDAMGDGFNAIAYLDADNWYDPDHIAGLVALQEETGADLVSSGRVIHAIDGSVLLPHGESGDGQHHADTSVTMFSRSAFAILPLWGTMPKELGPKCDHFMYKGMLALGCTHKHRTNSTVHFTSRYGPHYRKAGAEIPLAATAMHTMKEADQFARRLGAKGLSHILSGHSVESWFEKKQKNPIVFIVLGRENDLTETEITTINEIKEATKDKALLRFASEAELINETAFTSQHNNVFLIVFEGSISDYTLLEKTAEKRGDIALVYFRDLSEARDNNNVDTPLDRRAWKIILASESEVELYRKSCRYGSGHTIVAADSYITSGLMPCIQDYAR